jgi:hypothetical protein
MNLAIQGGFEAYVWAALWQVALGGLQAGGPPFRAKTAVDHWSSRLQHAVSLVGSAVSWIAWGLSVRVGIHDGLLAGVVFGIFSFAVNVLTLLELHRSMGRHAMAVQAVAFLAMPALAYKTLGALGIFIQ